MNLATIIDGHPGDNVALVGGDRSTTYHGLRIQVAVLRGGFARLGITAGDRVAIVSANDWAFVVTYLAVLGLGGVVVPLNPSSPAAELERELAAVGPEVVVVGPGGEHSMADVDLTRAGGTVTHVLTAEHVHIEGAEPFHDLFDADPVPVVDRSPDDLAVLIFTAGTGGSPKAAMLTHGNLLANLEQLQHHAGQRLEPSDVSYGVLPMFHIFGLNVVLGLTLFAGAAVVLAERFDPTAALDAIRTHGVTMLAGAPAMYAAISAVPDAGADDLASVRLAVTGAAPLTAEIATAFEGQFNLALSEGYGLTEASPVVTASVTGDHPTAGSIGIPIPGVEVRLVDEEGEDALMGDAGEIWVKGPNVFPGYWQDDEATRGALTADGWLRTGDVAVEGDDGELYLVDRVKDLIIVSGFNVYPAEVEDTLLTHPAVAEAAVVGIDHAYSGETVKAFVVLRSGSEATEGELIEYCARRLARYKCPSEISFVPSLPRGMGGKLLRRALAQ